MTTYVYHIERNGQCVKLATDLQEFLGIDLVVTECLELATTRSAVATVIESLFGATAELRPDPGDPSDSLLVRFDALFGPPDLAAADAAQAEAQAQAEQAQAEAQAEQADNLRLCAECGSPFVAEGRSKYCSKRCMQNASNRKWRAKQHGGNGNGRQPEPETTAVVEAVAIVEEPSPAPIAETPVEPVPDVIANQVMRWLIASSGKEIESITNLLVSDRLAVGERLHHVAKGWWEVFRNDAGVLDVRRVKEAA